jgi:hypothetical protein
MLTASERAALAGFRAERRPEVDSVFGPVSDSENSAASALATEIGQTVEIAFLLPDAATATYRYTTPDKLEIIDVTVIKDAAGAGNTIQVKNSAGTAISDAIAAAVDKTVTRAGTLDKATRVVAAGGEFQITNTRAAGSSAAAVFIRAIRRA